jgi:hypothetical protein
VRGVCEYADILCCPKKKKKKQRNAKGFADHAMALGEKAQLLAPAAAMPTLIKV